MAKTLSGIFGVIFLLLGMLGFVSNPLVGAGAIFAADAAHNLILLVFGALLLAAAFRGEGVAVLWLKIVGVAVFLLGLAGIFTVPASGGLLLGLAWTNGASDWLNLIAGLLVFLASYSGAEAAPPAANPASMPGT